VLVLLACWQPAPYTPPPAPEVEAEEVLSADEAENEEADAADEPPTEAGVNEEDPPTKPAFDDVPVKPYRGYTVGTPLSLVDDVGQLVATIGTPGTNVTVLAEGSVRVKIRCDGCSPVVEGYLQKDRVRK
jgi:hypothetical protein